MTHVPGPVLMTPYVQVWLRRSRRASPERSSRRADEADRVAARMGAARDAVGGVALDRLDRAVGLDVLDDADVLVEDDQVTRLGRVRRRSGLGATGALRPRVDGVDGARTGATV